MDAKAITAREAIAELSVAGLGTTELLKAVGERMRRVVPYATCAYMAMDPATLLPTGLYAHHSGGFDPRVHIAYAENEYLQDDFAKMADIAAASAR